MFKHVSVIKQASVALALCFSATALQVHAAEPAIQVNGTGSYAVVPDAYTITFVMEEKGETVSKLNAKMQDDMETVLKFLLKEGIEEKHVQSMQISLNPYYESTPQGREQRGFILSRQIQVTDTDINHYDRIIDGALSRGIDRIQGFEFIASQQDNAYEKALINAVKDAKLRASLLADQLGVKIGKVLSVTEAGNSYPMPVMRMEMSAKADFSSALPGEQMIEARVNVSFAIDE